MKVSIVLFTVIFFVDETFLRQLLVKNSLEQADCPDGFNGIKPDYFDCSKYIQCDQGVGKKMNCGHGTLFDTKYNVCNYAGHATCFNGEKRKAPKGSLPTHCGYTKDNLYADRIQTRMIGGVDARKGDYPWQAALRILINDTSYHRCGASIISSRWVITAGHCLSTFKLYPKDALLIVAGVYDTDENEDTVQQKYVDEIFVHEGYGKGHLVNNDIALIKVKGTGFELNDDVQPIRLADADTDYSKKLNCTISGFGSFKRRGPVSHKLQQAWIPIQSKEICTLPQVHGDSITDGMFCAGPLEGGIDACNGDSGGPLACVNGVFTLYGITSWGREECGSVNKPGVYVKVGKYRDWIEDIISKHS